MRGFSLVEVLISLLLMLVVTSALFGLMNPAQMMFAVQAELPDMQQRLRVAADALGRDLFMAGGGGFAPIVPHRRGMESPDGPGTFRSDRVSLLYVPSSASRATTSTVTDSSGTVLVNAQPGCAPSEPLCRFRTGMLAVIFDGTGAYDMLRISGISTEPPALLHLGFPLSKAYPPSATIAQAEAATYWLQVDPLTNVSQLMKYDGKETDLPLADNVTALRFEYYTDSLTRLDAAALTDGPWLPDSAFANRFDADLLRVRRVRATVRVRANQAILHAPIADREIRLEVAPRSQVHLP